MLHSQSRGSQPSFLVSEIRFAMSVCRQATSAPNPTMLNLNQSEAETLQRLLNGERLWSWPNGRIQLGQTFPDLAVINSLVHQGLLDQSYEPTEAGRAALQSWQSSIGLPATIVVLTSDTGPRPRLPTD